MKIALVGGSSNIGSHLIRYLSRKKINLIATYNSTKPKENKNIIWKKLNIKNKNKNFYKFLDCPDLVINLAWADIPNYKLKNHFKTFKYQKNFNYNIVNNGLKNLIVLGTCYEYGKKNGRINENQKEKPIIPYGMAKLKLLNSLKVLKKKKKFKFTWLRPFFVYGKNEKRNTLYTLIKNINKSEIKKISVCGNLIRDFVSIDFLCKTICKIIVLDKNFGVLNVSSGKGISIKKFVIDNLDNVKFLKKFDMNGSNPNTFEPNSFWGCNKKLKKNVY